MGTIYKVKYQGDSRDSGNALLRGKGSLCVESDSLAFEGREKKFLSWKRKTITIAMSSVYDVYRNERCIGFKYQAEGPVAGDGGLSRFVFYAENDDAAVEIERVLPRRMTPEFEKEKSELDRFNTSLVADSPHTYVIYLLVLLNIAAYIATAISSADITPTIPVLIKYGGNIRGVTAGNDEWWRLLTSAFLHGNFVHIMVNMWVLLSSGKLIERLYGSSFYLLVYLFAAVTGSLASIWWYPNTVSVGASGAIFGSYGALLAYVLVQKQSIPSSIVSTTWKSAAGFLAYNLIYGLKPNTGIDMAAHVGGLIGGFVMGLAVARPLDPETRSQVVMRKVITGLGIGAAIICLAIPNVPKFDPKFKTASTIEDRADASVDKGEYAQAIADYTELINMIPGSAIAYAKRGNAYHGKGEFDLALKDYDKAVELNKNFAAAYAGRAAVSLDKKQYDKAVEDSTTAIKIDPNFPRAYNIRGGANMDLGKLDQAIADYTKALELKPNYAIVFKNRALAFTKKKEHDKAIEDYTKRIELEPKDAIAYKNRGIAYSEKKGQYDLGISDFNKAIELNPGSSDLYNYRGWALGRNKQYDDAIADFTKCLELDPKNVWAYRNRGQVYAEHKNQLDQGIADYDKAIELNPRLAELYNMRGWAMANKKEYDRAFADYAKCLELDPKLVNAYTNRARIYNIQGRYDDAIGDCTKALEINSKYPSAYFYRTRAYMGKQQFDKAWDEVHAAEKLGIKQNPDLLKDLRKASGRNN